MATAGTGALGQIGWKRKHYKLRAEEDREHVLLVWSGSCYAVRWRGKGAGEEDHGLLCATVHLWVEEIA